MWSKLGLFVNQSLWWVLVILINHVCTIILLLATVYVRDYFSGSLFIHLWYAMYMYAVQLCNLVTTWLGDLSNFTVANALFFCGHCLQSTVHNDTYMDNSDWSHKLYTWQSLQVGNLYKSMLVNHSSSSLQWYYILTNPVVGRYGLRGGISYIVVTISLCIAVIRT